MATLHSQQRVRPNPELVEAVQKHLRSWRRGNGGRSMSAAKNGKDKDKKHRHSGDRQKEIDRLEKDVEDLRQLAGDEKADAEFERGQPAGC